MQNSARKVARAGLKGLRLLALNGMFSWSKVLDLSRSSRAKFKMVPHLKINFMIYRLTVESFMLLSQFAKYLSFNHLNGCTVRNTAERSFSKLRLIKTLHRSTITDESLTNLVIVSIESETFTALVAKTLDMTD